MQSLKSTFILFLLFITCVRSEAQQNFCPTNIDFEQGNFFNWLCYTGTCCPINITSGVVPPVAGRHEITNTTQGNDPFGNFPVVAPGGNQHSLKLGNSSTGAQAERVRYYVQVPAGLNNYSLIYRYAVVFENPSGHGVLEQPRFEVKGFDSATMTPIPCATYTYVSSGNGNNGFSQSTVLSQQGIYPYYKAWTTSSLNLSGWGGHTVLLEFSSGDCSLSGHFGYGYVDMNCGLFQVSGNVCGSSTTVLSAPYGFQTYTWYNDNYTTIVGSGQVVSINTPPVTSTYHVVIIPQSGFGCPDTLTTTIQVTDLTLTTSNDTTICSGANVPLSTVGTGSAQPLTYSWYPTTGLSCSNCQFPTAMNVTSSITYYAAVTDTNGCVVIDTVDITVNNFTSVTMNVTNVACNGGNNGSIQAVPVGGQPPYTYLWNNGQTTQTATSLAPGNYTVTVTDNMGCQRTGTATVTQPTPLNLNMSATSINCYGQTNGTASVVVSGGTFPYTYLWSNGQQTSTATGLVGGTYTVTVTDANGCTQTGSATVASPTALVATITASTNINCNGQSTGSATVTVSGGTAPYTYFWSTFPTQYTATASGLPAGTYTVQVTDAHNCVTSATVTITQPPVLNAVITNQVNTSCNQANGSATASANGGTPPYTYSWSNSQTGPNATGLAYGTYVVTVTDSKGCTDTAHVNIATSVALNLTTTTTPANCNGQSNGSAGVQVSGGVQPYTYLWNTVPQQTTSNATNIPAGTYTVTVTDANNCITPATVTVTQPTAVLGTISNTVNNNCYGGSSGHTTVVASGGTPGYTYSWNTVPVQTTANASSLTAGTYVVTVTDSHGCTDTAHSTITQPTQVTVTTPTVANATCSQNNGSVTAVANGGTPGYTYSWNTVPVQNTATATGLGAGTFIVTATDANGCTGQTSVTVTQSATLTIDTVTTDVSCHGLADGTASVIVSTGTPPYNYTWSNAQTTPSISNLAAGVYTLNVTDAIGCPGTASVTIEEPAVLDAIVSNVQNVKCFGQQDGSAMASANGGTNPYAYLWSTGSTIQNPTSLDTGTYKMIVTDANGCTDSTDIHITQPDELLLSAQSLNASCEGAAQGTADAVASGGTTPYTYLWGTTPAQNGTTAQSLNPGNYTVTVTDDNGCYATASVVIGGYPLPTVNAGADQVYCNGLEPVMLNVTGADTYQWSPANGLSCTDCPSPTAMPGSTTTYHVVGTDANNCTNSDDVTVTVYYRGTVSAGTDMNICVGDVAQLNATGGESYKWTPSTALDNSSIANPSATPVKTTTYTVVITENACFADTLSQTINVYERPTVTLGPDRKELSGSIIELRADTTYASSIEWTPPSNLSCTDCDNPTVNVEKTATYVVTVANPGCTATDDININVTCDKLDLFVANTFTPNADGNNDAFYPQTPGLNKIKLMMVYNRWGEKVFEAQNFPANNPRYGWDGTYKGVPLSPDTYVYMLEYICGDGTSIQLKGDISLVR